MTTDDSEFHTGAKSFLLAAEDASGTFTGAQLVSGKIQIEPSSVYTIALWAKVDVNDGQNRPVRLRVDNPATGNAIFTRDITFDSIEWKQYFFTFTTTDQFIEFVELNFGISRVPTDFWIDDLRFYEGVPNNEFLSGDVSADGGVTSYDAALALQFAALLVVPTDAELRAADMDGDGVVRSNDAILILRKSVGLAAPSTDILATNGGPVTIALNETYGAAGERVTVPLTVDDVSILAGGDICINYDASVLRATGVLFDPETMLVSNTNEPGTVLISFVNSRPMENNIVARMQFEVLADENSMLMIRNADLYTPEGLPLISGTIDKGIISWATPPERSALMQNFPNPFNPDTWIPFQLKGDSEVAIRIFNLRGELVREFDLGHKSAGVYTSRSRAAHWDGRNNSGEVVASGLYFYSISTDDFSAVKKLTISR